MKLKYECTHIYIFFFSSFAKMWLRLYPDIIHHSKNISIITASVRAKFHRVIKNPECSVNVYCGRFALSIGRICHPERNKFNLFGLRRISSQSFGVSSPSSSLWQYSPRLCRWWGKKSSNVDSRNKSNFAIAGIYRGKELSFIKKKKKNKIKKDPVTVLLTHFIFHTYKQLAMFETI